MYYDDVFSALSYAGVRYLVVGGTAVNLHGIPRMTMDVDIMLDFAPENVKKFSEAIKGIGYVPRNPVRVEDLADPTVRRSWQKGKHAVVMTVWKPTDWQHVDVFLYHPIPFEAAYRRRKEFRFGDWAVPVVDLDDLVRLKEKAGRLQDKADIRAIRKLRRAR